MMQTDPWLVVISDTARSWWLHLVRGVAAIVFGVIAIAFPGITLAVLSVLVAVWAFVLGFSEIGQAVRLRTIRRRLSI
jgi:uncharacterized membrane protein HdeD (DUF308 family)